MHSKRKGMRHTAMLLALLLLTEPARGAASARGASKTFLAPRRAADFGSGDSLQVQLVGTDVDGKVGKRGSPPPAATSAIENRVHALDSGKSDDEEDPCSPYKLQSEQNVKNFLANFQESEDGTGKSSAESTAHAELVQRMADLSDEEYKTLQTALVKRADLQTSMVIDDATIQQALDETTSLNLPKTVMGKLRYSDGVSSQHGGSDFVNAIKFLDNPALKSVLDQLLLNTPPVVRDVFGSQEVRGVVSQFIAGKPGEALADGIALLPNLPSVAAVLSKVNETAIGFLEKNKVGETWAKLPTIGFEAALTAMARDPKFMDLVRGIPDQVDEADDVLRTTLDGTLGKIGSTMDGFFGQAGDNSGQLNFENLVLNPAQTVAQNGLKAVPKIVDQVVQHALDNNEVNQNVINAQLGQLSQQLASDFIGKGYDTVKLATSVAVPGSAAIFKAAESLGLDRFIIDTIPKLLRLAFDAMFQYGPSWLRAMVQNVGGFTGAVNLFIETLEVFSPKGWSKIMDGLMSLFTGEFLQKSKCSLSVLGRTLKLAAGAPMWDEKKTGAVKCAEKGLQCVHFAMPDPDDPLRRRERPATVEKNWFECRERCFELQPACTFFSFWQSHKLCYLLNSDAREAWHNFDMADWVTGTADGVLAGQVFYCLRRPSCQQKLSE
eukprot:g18023.t1